LRLFSKPAQKAAASCRTPRRFALQLRDRAIAEWRMIGIFSS
jgi:hypothetical protein